MIKNDKVTLLTIDLIEYLMYVTELPFFEYMTWVSSVSSERVPYAGKLNSGSEMIKNVSDIFMKFHVLPKIYTLSEIWKAKT